LNGHKRWRLQCRRKKFTFAMSSSDKLLSSLCLVFSLYPYLLILSPPLSIIPLSFPPSYHLAQNFKLGICGHPAGSALQRLGSLITICCFLRCLSAMVIKHYLFTTLI